MKDDSVVFMAADGYPAIYVGDGVGVDHEALLLAFLRYLLVAEGRTFISENDVFDFPSASPSVTDDERAEILRLNEQAMAWWVENHPI